MKKLFLAIFISFLFAHIGLSQSITFSDQVVEDAVRESLWWAGIDETSILTLQNLDQVTYLKLDSSSLSNLTDLKQLPNLQYLYLDDASGVADFSPLGELNSSLIALYIRLASSSALSDLPDMENLQSLGLENNKLNDVSFLLDNNFSSLTHLDLEENYLDLGDNATLEKIAILEARVGENISQGNPTWYGSGVEYGLMYPKGFQNLSSERNRVSSGADPQSLLLKGIYELLHIFEDRSSSSLQEFAIKIGVESSIRGFLLSDLPTLESYDANLSENLQTDELAKYFQNSLIPALKRADNAFASVQTSEAIELPSNLTGSSDDFTVDQADIYVLRAITNLAAGLASLQAGYDWNFKIGDVNALDDADQLTAESLFDLNANFAGIRNTSMLANSKSYIEKAIEVYELASPLLKDANRSEDRLFTLSAEDFQDENDFREDLEDLYEVIQGPIDPEEEDSFDLSRLFAGKVDLPDLLPSLDGDKFITSEVLDPTMGGLMPNWDQRRVRQEMISADLLAYAPSTLIGQKLTIQNVGISTNDYFFTNEGAYFWDENALELNTIPFSYDRNSSDEATLILSRDSGDDKHLITFTSSLEASLSWENNTSHGIGTIQILAEEYAPDYLNGWKLDAGVSTYKLTGDSTGVFYHVDEGNYSNSELSNITYTWEKAGPGIGKLYTSLDEITWLFFEDNTTGRYHWQEQEQDNNDSGNFSLNYYPGGHAHESMTGNSLKLGDITYVFTSDTSVTVTEGNASTVLEYAYLKNGSSNGILSLDPENKFAIMDLTFYSSGYGRVDRGGSGYFRVLQNWATKGWIWQDHYPWAYSDNMQDWFYQILFINDENESDMAHYQVWDNQWNIPDELHYSGESNFSSADAYYWEDYDDFNGTELNSSKWGTMYLGGGIEPYVSGGKLVLSAVSGNSSSVKVVKAGWADIFQNDDGGQAWVYPMDNEIMGIEAEFVIPGSVNSMSGLALGVASLSPFTYATAELNADPNSASQYSQGFGFYHLANDGSEVENFGTTQRDTTHRLGATFIEGKIKLHVDGEIRYESVAGTFNTDMFFLNGFNDYQGQGLAFDLTVDNVRVLRKKSYPQGWMWMDYYPWAYSQESNSWLYFQLAKDADGQPGMIYWDTATKDWDIYYPSLSAEQAEDQENATNLLNQE